MGKTDLQRTVGALQIVGGIASLYYGGAGGAGGAGLIGSGIQNVSGSDKGSFNRGGAGFLSDLGLYAGGNALGGAVGGNTGALGGGSGFGGLGGLLGGGSGSGSGAGPLGGLLGGLLGGGQGGSGKGGQGGTGSAGLAGLPDWTKDYDIHGGAGLESGGFSGGQPTGGSGLSALASPQGMQLASMLTGAGGAPQANTPAAPPPNFMQPATPPQDQTSMMQQAVQGGQGAQTTPQSTGAMPNVMPQVQLPKAVEKPSPDILKLIAALQGNQGAGMVA